MARNLSEPFQIGQLDSIPIFLTYKTVKRININLRENRIDISAPPDVSVDYIENILRENKEKYLKRLEKIKNYKPNSNLPAFEHVSDIRSILIFGKRRKIEYQNIKLYQLTKKKIILTEDIKNFSLNSWIEVVDKFIEGILILFIRERLDYWSEKAGIEWKEFSIRKMKTRWGSCTVQKRTMRFNFYLAMLPKPVIDSVIIHELVHILEANHQKGFYNVLLKNDPDYYQKNNKLKKYHPPIPYLF